MRRVVKIPTGGTGLAEAVKVRGYKVTAIQMPTAWEAAGLTFRGSSVELPGRTQVVPNGVVAGLAVDANAEDIQMTNPVGIQVVGSAPIVTPAKVDPIVIDTLLAQASTITTSDHGILWVFQNVAGTVSVQVDKAAADHTSAIMAWAQYSKPALTLPPAFGAVPIGAVRVTEGGSGAFTWGTDSITGETEAYFDFSGLPEVLIRGTISLDTSAATFTYGAVTIRLGTGARVAATGKVNVAITGSDVVAGSVGAWLIYVLADDVEYALQLGEAYPTLLDAQAAVANHVKNPMLTLIAAMYVVNGTGGAFVPGTTDLDATDIGTTFETFGPTHMNLQDDNGNELALTAAADEYLILDAGSKEALRGLQEIQVRSGTSGTPVDQTASPDLTLVLERA